MRNPERRNELISRPANFSHVVHMGPGEGLEILKDLPTVSIMHLMKLAVFVHLLYGLFSYPKDFAIVDIVLRTLIILVVFNMTLC